MSTLSFKKVNKIYPNNVQAVFDFNLEVKDKEFIVFVGPSGCGKSTTLRMVAGLEDISNGEIWIDDTCVNVVPPKDRDIAMVFQNYALYPHMTVFKNMAFALELRKVYMPLKEVDVNNPKYIEEKEALTNSINEEIKEKVAQMKAAKESKENIAQYKFTRESDLKAALLELDEKYSVQTMTFDHAKVDELEKQIKELSKVEPIDQEKINALKKEIEEVIHVNNTPAYTYRHYTNKEITDRVLKAADILGLRPYLKRKPAALSGGQRQRVALGRAIVRNPKVFLMDEPLSNLDAKLRVQTRSEIIRIHERVGATTIYVTHDQTEAMTMADRIVIMKDGYIQQIGTPKEVYEEPVNMFVAGFIGSPSMNFINAIFNGKELEIAGENKISISLEKKQIEALNDYKDKEVIVGIRPEDFYVDKDPALSSPSKPIDVMTEMSELLGYESIVYGTLNNQKVVIKISSKNNVELNKIQKFCFDKERIHFFDKDTTNVIK